MREVDKQAFWEGRIREAGDNIRLSVYQCEDKDWEKINEVHRNAIRIHCHGKVLDVGCGYGRASEWVDPNYDDYTGIDFSKEFIDLAKQKYPDRKFFVMDLEKGLDFKDGEFDWAICLSMEAMIVRELGQERWDKMLEEIKRVAKKVIILEYSYLDKYEIISPNTNS